jgi:hypothetical protein
MVRAKVRVRVRVGGQFVRLGARLFFYCFVGRE